ENLTGLLAAAKQASAALMVTLLTVALIALVVSGIGIMNVMLVSVTERTREIGVRKVVGARRLAILAQFLIEASVISGLGALAGVSIAVAAIVLVRSFLPQDVSLPISSLSILVAMAASASVGLIAGYLPARRAANLPSVFSLAFTQTLFDSPARGRQRAARQRVEVQELATKRIRETVMFEAASAYLELAGVRESIERLRGARESAQAIVDLEIE